MNEADKAFVRSVVLRGVNATEEWLLRIIREQEAELSALREERRERPMSEHPALDNPKCGSVPVLLHRKWVGEPDGGPCDEYIEGCFWDSEGECGWVLAWAGVDISEDEEEGEWEYVGWLPMPEPGKGGT